jgi:L-seryl-tRNA(Ser) seleniumtransferase
VILESRSAQDLAADLRTGDPAILARVHEDAVLLDLRTLDDEEVERVVGRVRGLAGDATGI